MPFRFSLEGILSFRKNVEHAEEIALNKILQEIATTQQQLQRLQTDHRLIREQRDCDLVKGLPAAFLKELTEKEQYLENAINVAQAWGTSYAMINLRGQLSAEPVSAKPDP